LPIHVLILIKNPMGGKERSKGKGERERKIGRDEKMMISS